MSVESQTVRVELAERSYDIEIGAGSLDSIARFVLSRCDAKHVVIVTDANVDGLYADSAGDRFVDEAIETHVLVVDAGEPSKSPEVAAELWETMLEEGADRQSVVIAVGGGVVGDLAGFVAASYARGVPFFQVPTTLLAQVDSSVGGKVGVNLPGGKNMVGAFWQPRGVLVDVNVLGSLPDREFRAGLAEVVKYGVILDEGFFKYLEDHADAINARDPASLTHLIARSCELKAEVVRQDEREETGLRAILNYGHTFCHALEAATNYTTLLHGEGVAIGMLCASRLAERLGMVDAQCTARQQRVLEQFSLPLSVPAGLDSDELVRLMFRDKKVQDGKLRFVLPTRIGAVELVDDVSVSDAQRALGE